MRVPNNIYVQSGLWAIALLGYIAITLAVVSLVLGAAFWLSDAIPPPNPDGPAWQMPVGTALGYGIVALAMAAPVWLVGCLFRRLRWLRAWVLATTPNTALLLVAVIVAAVRDGRL